MNGIFENLSQEWFSANCTGDPLIAFTQWQEWLTKNPKKRYQTKYRKALQLLSGLHESSIRHYLSGRTHKLGKETLTLLDQISASLGVDAPERPKRRHAIVSHRLKRIALLAEFSDIPSLSYHFEVIRHVILHTFPHHYTVSLHQVSSHQLSQAVTTLLRVSRPDAIVMLRITPDADSLHILERAAVPVLLIHADRFTYPPPVLGNIVPLQERIKVSLKNWVSGLPGSKPQSKIVVVSMQPEHVPPRNFPRAESRVYDPKRLDTTSIRNERILNILEAVESFNVIQVHVDDYSFRHALTVYQHHHDALAFICLSDQIAIALKHLLIATEKATAHRIIGFDDSKIAQQENITSFGQKFDEIGEVLAERLVRWFGEWSQRNDSSLALEWPEFQEIPVEIHLILRD